MPYVSSFYGSTIFYGSSFFTAGPSNRPAPPPTPVLNIMTGDGSASSPTSLVKLEGAPSRLRTSQERNADRNKLFSPYPSASGNNCAISKISLK